MLKPSGGVLEKIMNPSSMKSDSKSSSKSGKSNPFFEKMKAAREKKGKKSSKSTLMKGKD